MSGRGILWRNMPVLLITTRWSATENNVTSAATGSIKESAMIYKADYMGSRVWRGYNYRRTYHPEYGGYVFQLDTRVFGWREPYTTEREAKAFIDGWVARSE